MVCPGCFILLTRHTIAQEKTYERRRTWCCVWPTDSEVFSTSCQKIQYLKQTLKNEKHCKVTAILVKNKRKTWCDLGKKKVVTMMMKMMIPVGGYPTGHNEVILASPPYFSVF